MIKYLGSKRKLLSAIVDATGKPPCGTRVLDLFSGTARVSRALKEQGFQVVANDHNHYAHCLARCYVEGDLDTHFRRARSLVQELNQVSGAPGWFTQTFCEDAQFFHPKNGARVDAIRDVIAAKSLDPVLESILLVSLMEAADRVDSTCGVQMAYLKQWAPRALTDLELRVPDLVPRARHGPGQALRLEALDAATQVDSDIAYLDPPYNHHSYLANYHVWESLVLWDHPSVYGKAQKRIDCKERKSAFNSKRSFAASFAAVLERLSARCIIVSFSDEGFVSREQMTEMLSRYGDLQVFAHDYKRYVGAQIGIHNPAGKRVGEVSHLRNTEFLFVVHRDPVGVGNA